MNTWLIAGCGSLISVQTKSTLNRNEWWELWPYLKVLRSQMPRGVQNHFQSPMWGTWSSLHAGSIPRSLDTSGARELCAFEVAKLVNWKCWCHWLGCQSVTSALLVLGNLTWVQGRPSSLMPGFILIYTDWQRITWVCAFSPPPLCFFKWTKGRLRSSCSAVRTGVLTIHGSEALQHFGQTGRNKKEAGPVYHSTSSGPLHIGALVPEVLVSLQELRQASCFYFRHIMWSKTTKCCGSTSY